MDRASPFRILSLEEFDGLSLEEKLAYLDLQLTNLYGEAWRERLENEDTEKTQASAQPTFH